MYLFKIALFVIKLCSFCRTLCKMKFFDGAKSIVTLFKSFFLLEVDLWANANNANFAKIVFCFAPYHT